MTINMRGGGGPNPDTPPQQTLPQVNQPPPIDLNPSPAVSHQMTVPLTEDSIIAVNAGGDNDRKSESGMDEQDEFPLAELSKFDEMINRPRWVVPVLPNGELELLLIASVDLCRRGIDTQSKACQRFFRDGLTVSFTKILTDEAVSGWKFEIHRCILKGCERLVELCVIKLNQDWFPLLDLLAMLFNPNTKFHTYNGARPPEYMVVGAPLQDDEMFARPPDPRNPKGWLVDLINRFGQLKGFQIILDRFQNGSDLSLPLIAALLRPFGLCYELLTLHVVKTFFLPIVDIVPKVVDSLSDEELNREAKSEAKNDALASIIKTLRSLVARLANHEETLKNLEIFRLKMILRLLQISPFNGKMNALNEVNKLIASLHYFSHNRNGVVEEEDWLTADRMAEWIKENRVLQIVLRDNLHQPQYVEKLEKILRFMIKEKALTVDDLDNIWMAQAGKHEAIVKNVHDLLAKLAWDFSPDQLDHLFECFQMSWTNASKKQREKLLELIRRLAEDDKDGVMAHKVLTLLWNLSHSDDVPTDIMDQALAAHVKILDYSCSQDRDAQKTHWLDMCVEEMKSDNWVLPALTHIREICCLYSEAPANASHTQRSPHMLYRHEVINKLQKNHTLVIMVADNLTGYMERAKQFAQANPGLDPNSVGPNSRWSHIANVQDRLNFLRFLLKDGQLWLCAPQAKQIWACLAENAVYLSDREACFKWFSKLMGDDADLDPDINREFFESNILQLDPTLLTESGMKCFDRFFKPVNAKEGKLIARRRVHLMDDTDLIGYDYLWKVVLCGTDEVADKAIELIKETYTNLGPRLQNNQADIHEDFLQSCMDRLKATYDTISILEKDNNDCARMKQETVRMTRVLKMLYEYVSECDKDYSEDRSILPMARAYRGKQLSLIIKFPNQGRQIDDLDIWSHSNETLASIKRVILNKAKVNAASVKVELYINSDLLDHSYDKKLVSQIPLRDKMCLNAKLSQAGTNIPSSPDSSSESSTGSPQRTVYDGLGSTDTEHNLPAVLMSLQSRYAQFLWQLSDLGIRLQIPALRDSARNILYLMPPDLETTQRLNRLDTPMTSGVATDIAGMTGQQVLQIGLQNLDALYFDGSSSHVLYNLEVTYALLMPAHNPLAKEAAEFQCNFIRSGGVQCILKMLTKNNFLQNADAPTKRSAYLMVLKICKLILTSVGHSLINMGPDCVAYFPNTNIAPSVLSATLRQAFQHIPNPSGDYMVRSVAARMAQTPLNPALQVMPDLGVIFALIRLAWAASAASIDMIHNSFTEIHAIHDKHCNKMNVDDNILIVESEDTHLCREALEVLSIAMALCPTSTSGLERDTNWRVFILDMVLRNNNSFVRVSAAEQMNLIATKCSYDPRSLEFFTSLLFSVLNTTVREYSRLCREYFHLLTRLINNASMCRYSLMAVESLIHGEIGWLTNVRTGVVQTGRCDVEETLLEGHLRITKELLAFVGSDKKFELGADKQKGVCLIQDLMEQYVFPASKAVVHYQQLGEMPSAPLAVPVCSTPATVNAALDLVAALCTGCVQNLKLVSDMLTNMYYSSKDQPLTEWEYMPPIGPRPNSGFVGLKNAGATCYMNSVLQQLYMIEDIRNVVLGVDGACTDPSEDLSGEDRANENEIQNDVTCDASNSSQQILSGQQGDESRKEYNIGVLKQIQAIFGHLAFSKLQYYVPRGLWKHFKLAGEPVNLREQHDALEFFNSLVDSMDEALKHLGHSQILSNVLGGSFADQKICKDCPHRYSREESFTTLNIDIRNHSNLLDSLEQYVKGDLLEGANAYHCEKCNKKVNTMKRMCIKKLPSILAIQLKRFDYDWERECAIKFNDYFEFPRVLDMGPYTVNGLAKIDGEVIEEELEIGVDGKLSQESTLYKLTGIVVHSGQASGGHYYSYILHRNRDGSGGDGNGAVTWYKFDDGEVTECKMEDDEEMKGQCFGGEYVGEVFDHMMKKMAYRRQKRWWNAYILFYQRIGEDDRPVDRSEQLTAALQQLVLSGNGNQSPVPSQFFHALSTKMPLAVQHSVNRQNVLFQHQRNQFSQEYFQFIKQLLYCNAPYTSSSGDNLNDLDEIGEQLAMITVQLGTKFLFFTGFHTKKILRGSALEWYEALSQHMRCSKAVRSWFIHSALFDCPSRFAEYMLESPSSEVRMAFVKTIVFLAHFSSKDGPSPPPANASIMYPESMHAATLSDHLLLASLSLLKKEVSEYGRHLMQYFTLFVMYAGLGVTEKKQLLRLQVPATFISVAIDEGPGPAIKYQYAELTKLYQVVSQLVRCCDVSSKCIPPDPELIPMTNLHGDPALTEIGVPLPPQVEDLLYNRTNYVKKIIEDANTSEDTVKLLRFCSWENPSFSSTVLGELLWQIAYSYTYELRPHLHLLLHMLLLDDSWQTHRIHNALKGMQDDKDGLFDTIQRSKNHYQKRAYQAIKCLTSLFTNCPVAMRILQTNGDIKRKWSWAVEWLHDELERRPYAGNAQYGYNNWSPPAQSNETSNGYFLERSNSARQVLAKACQLLPAEEEHEDQDQASEEGDSPQTTDSAATEILATSDNNEGNSQVNAAESAEQNRNSFQCDGRMRRRTLSKKWEDVGDVDVRADRMMKKVALAETSLGTPPPPASDNVVPTDRLTPAVNALEHIAERTHDGKES